MIIADTDGSILHATFLTANVAQAATAPSNGRVYVAATQTIFSTPTWGTWRGILRFNQDIIPAEKASPSCLVHAAYYTPVPVSPGALMTLMAFVGSSTETGAVERLTFSARMRPSSAHSSGVVRINVTCGLCW